MTIKSIPMAAVIAALCASAWATTPAHAQSKHLKGAEKDTLAGAGATKAGAAHYWYDGDIRRPLWVEQAGSGTKDGPAIALRDAPAGGQARTLPGGVIVRLKQPMSDEAARNTLAAKGLTAVHPIGQDASSWLVEADPGLESLALANRLYESGDFAAASPNWKRERAKK